MKKNQKVESLKKREIIKLIAIYTWDNFTLTKSNLHLRTSHERVRQKNDHLRFLSAMNLLIFWTPNNNLYCLLSFSRGAVKTSHEVQSFLLR